MLESGCVETGCELACSGGPFFPLPVFFLGVVDEWIGLICAGILFFCRRLSSGALLDALLSSKYSRSVEQLRACSWTDRASIPKTPSQDDDRGSHHPTCAKLRSVSPQRVYPWTQINTSLSLLSVTYSPLFFGSLSLLDFDVNVAVIIAVCVFTGLSNYLPIPS